MKKQSGYRLDNTAKKVDPKIFGSHHFKFEINQKSFAYCYIRKNACSAFKRLIVSTSPFKNQIPDFPGTMRFLSKFHGTSIPGINSADHSILVVRDPIDRLVSAYLNKFVQKAGHEDVASSYQRLCQQDPDQASFQDVVFRYLDNPMELVDSHFWAQSSYLAPTAYTDCIQISSLETHMRKIMGKEVSEEYFKKPINSSREFQELEIDDASKLTAAKLREIYLVSSQLPAPNCLVTPRLRQRISKIYAEDFRLADEVSSS